MVHCVYPIIYMVHGILHGVHRKPVAIQQWCHTVAGWDNNVD